MPHHCDRRITGDAFPTTYKPPVPRPMRMVLKVGHNLFLLPGGLGVQEAAALAYTLGQSVQVTQHYDAASGAYKTEVAHTLEYAPVSLSLVDPKDVSEGTNAPTGVI